MAERGSYYFDEHVANAITKGLRQRGVDVRTTGEAGLIGASDEQQLAFATEEGRVLCTNDDDFLRCTRPDRITRVSSLYGNNTLPGGHSG